MPLVKIETRREWLTADQKAQLFDAVHSALVVAFRIPESDRNQRLVEYDSADFESASGKGERFTIVTIDSFAGRSMDAKRTLCPEMVLNLERIGIPPSDVVVVIHDIPSESWGVRGGKLASEVDLGFDIQV